MKKSRSSKNEPFKGNTTNKTESSKSSQQKKKSSYGEVLRTPSGTIEKNVEEQSP